MSYEIDNYDFEGLFDSISSLKDQSGVYAIIGWDSEERKEKIVDIGQADKVKKRVDTHDREDCWKDYKFLKYAVLYCDEKSRKSIEKELREKINPPCGER